MASAFDPFSRSWQTRVNCWQWFSPFPGVLGSSCSPLLLPPRAGCDYLLRPASDLMFWWCVTLLDVNGVMDAGGPTLSRPKLNHHRENVMRGIHWIPQCFPHNNKLFTGCVLISSFKPYGFKYPEISRWPGLAFHVNFLLLRLSSWLYVFKRLYLLNNFILTVFLSYS